jgi:hypothetical protein
LAFGQETAEALKIVRHAGPYIQGQFGTLFPHCGFEVIHHVEQDFPSAGLQINWGQPAKVAGDERLFRI